MTRFGEYELEERAGRGGMGTVWRARDRRSGATVAVKVLDRASEGGLTRFAREARVLASLHHPSVVRYLDHGVTGDGLRYLVTEWLEGSTLDNKLASGPLTIADCVRLGKRIANALAAVHAQGIVHRDVKPSNLFLVDGEVAGVKVLDFGLASLDGTALSATRTGHLVGTPEYMSPEQARGDKGVDARADVFGLGCVLYECLTGAAPFAGEHLVAVLGKILFADPTPLAVMRPETPSLLAELIARMLMKERDRRPADGEEVAAILSELAVGPGASEAPRVSSTVPFGWTGQQVVSVVIAANELRNLPTGETAPSLVVGSNAETVIDDRPTLARLRGKMSSLGAAIEELAADAYVATLAGHGTATDQATAAARCALRLREELPGTTVVVVTGRGVLGGAIPVGDVIDRAVAVLRDLSAGPGAIRIDEVTAGLLDARFAIGSDGGGAVLLDERPQGDATRTLLGRPTQFVGRHRELSVLEGSFAASVEESQPRAALVVAGTGIGKSRLRYELVRRIEAGHSNAQIMIGWGDPTHAGSALGILADGLRRAIGLREDDAPETARARLRARVGRHVAFEERERVTVFLGEIVGVPFPDGDSPPLRAARRDPRLLADQMRRAFVDWVRAEASAQPVVLVLEDLHWADPQSVGYVDAALAACAAQPLFVVGIARPEVDALFPEMWGECALDRIALGELPARAAEALVRQVLGEVATPEVVKRVVELAGGNAFHLEELIRAVAEGRGDYLPATLVAATQARLEALAPELRRTLRAASVVGDRFSPAAVAAVLGDGSAALEPLIELELVTRASDDELVFRHAIVLDAAYASLTPGDRTIGHGRAAVWLTAQGGDPAAIAEHFDRSDRTADAAPWWCSAAERAFARDDLDAAIRHAERALARQPAPPDRGRAHVIQGEVLAWRGDLHGAARAADEARELLAPGSERWCRAIACAITSSGRLGDYVRVEELAQAVFTATIADDAVSAQVAALCAATSQLLHAGRYATAVELAGRVARMDQRIDAATEAQVHRLRAACARQFGDPWGDASGYRAALDAWERAGDRRSACNARVSLGFALAELGDLEVAEGELRRAEGDAERLGLGPIATRARHNLGMVLCERGALDEAEAVEQRAADESRAQGNARFEGGSRVYLSAIALRRGDPVRAEIEASSAARLFAPTPPARAGALAAWARALLAQGRHREALRVATEARDHLDRLGSVEEYEFLIRGAHAEALLACDRIDDARVAVSRAMERLQGRAACIPDDASRARFLGNDSDNAAIVRIAVWFGMGTIEERNDTLEVSVPISGEWGELSRRKV